MKSGKSRTQKELPEDESDDHLDVKPLEDFAAGDQETEQNASDESPDSDADSELDLEEAEAGTEGDEAGDLGGSSDDDELGLQDDEFELENASEDAGAEVEAEEGQEFEDEEESARELDIIQEGAEGAVGGSKSESDEDLLEEEAALGASSEEEEEEGPSTTGRGKDGKTLVGAFAEILAHPGPANKKDKAPILLGSKSIAKRRREEVETTAAQRAAKKLRQEMKQRGHVAVSKKGEDPVSDAQEKLLYKVATRGVVQLFNAVSKAQRAQKDALAAGAKAKDAKINKSTFFQELRGKNSQTAEPSGKKNRPGIVPQEGPDGREVRSGQGWDVLKEDFAGLQGTSSTKMKDWDKAVDSDELVDEAMSGSESEGLGDW